MERDKDVIAACSGPGAGSDACKQKRAEVVLAEMGYEDGPYNSKYEDAYPDEYQHISAILNQTSQKTQDQLAIRDAVAANLAKTDDISLDEAYKKYDRYAATRDVIAIVGGTIGGVAVVNRIPGEKVPRSQVSNVEKGNVNLDIKQLPDANGKIHLTAVKGDATIPVDKIELYMRGKALGDLESLKKEYSSLKDLQIRNQKEFAKTPGAREKLNKLTDQIHNIERSQDMARVLNDAGINNTAKNNAMIMDKLLDSTDDVTSSNRQSSIVVSGLNGSVRIYATWKILPNGTKRLATVNAGTFK